MANFDEVHFELKTTDYLGDVIETSASGETKKASAEGNLTAIFWATLVRKNIRVYKKIIRITGSPINVLWHILYSLNERNDFPRKILMISFFG